ncbi:MAG: hypothetical protein P8Q99_00660 [Paracoccaceae bacterium]|nr:hypothetical protein [Paracoccaceae bacterium]
MYQIPVNKISMIFDREFEGSIRAVLEQIQSRGAPFNRFHFHADCRDGLVLLMDDACHIALKSENTPMKGDRFEPALAKEVENPKDLHLRQLIRQHKSVLTFSVGKGSLAKRGETATEKRAFEPALSLTDRATMWQLLHALLNALVGQRAPLAVLFHATHQLLEPAEIIANDRAGLPLKSMINPSTFSSGTKIKGNPLVGFRAMGSEVILGRRLILHEINLPLNQSMGLATKVMQTCYDNGVLMPNGHHTTEFTGATLDIRQRPPSAANPFGTFELLFSDVHHANENFITADTLRQSIFGRKFFQRPVTLS